jgi:hypothetical protein
MILAKARAYVAGRLKVSEILVADEGSSGNRLSSEPRPTRTAKEVILEIAFEETVDLSPYVLEIMDTCGDEYELPGWVLDTARVRQLSEAETMVIAHSALEHIMPPGTTPLCKDIAAARPSSRLRRSAEEKSFETRRTEHCKDDWRIANGYQSTGINSSRS